MIPELGHLALWLALGLALGLTLVPTIGVWRRDPVLQDAAGFLAAGLFVFLLLAYCCLSWAFLADDFSVQYVALHSNTELPVYYRLSAVWGAHEGSLLLWNLIMAGWTLAAALGARTLPADVRARLLAVMGLLSAGFLLFLLLTSNPFERLLPLAPREGGDLNPQLQDIGLILHPPMLYLGYVGFSVTFAFAIAALWRGQLTAAEVRWLRPWASVSWSLLGLGIVLGSWWAYHELGWGGWWFWDAVENVSFIPWLAATALLHCLAVSEKRGLFKSWTLLLALATFSLSLLGAFIVRSGVLISVHSFAQDPERGIFILGFLVVVIGGALTLYAVRGPKLVTLGNYGWLSRETLLSVNNLLLTVSLGTVLLGTLFPLAYEVFSGGDRISVGKQWFNAVFVPLVVLLAACMALAPLVRWKNTSWRTLIPHLRWSVPAAAGAGLVLPFLFTGSNSPGPALGTALGVWIILTLLQDLARRRPGKGRLGAPNASIAAMWMGHLGFAICLLGICLTSYYSKSKELPMAPGDAVTIGTYTYTFEGTRQAQGPNYSTRIGRFRVTDGSDTVILEPEKRHYQVRAMTTTEAAVDPGLFRDLYIALGEPLAADGAWAVRIYYKAFVRWIWFGGLLMGLSGLMILLDKRYHRRRAPASAAITPGLTQS